MVAYLQVPFLELHLFECLVKWKKGRLPYYISHAYTSIPSCSLFCAFSFTLKTNPEATVEACLRLLPHGQYSMAYAWHLWYSEFYGQTIDSVKSLWCIVLYRTNQDLHFGLEIVNQHTFDLIYQRNWRPKHLSQARELGDW